jgi:carbamate kinase
MQFIEGGNENLAVIAFGGNAILRKGEQGDFRQQFANTRTTMQQIAGLLERGLGCVLTHGNGPQVGNLMLMSECARETVPPTPLGIADAMTCGSMGYMIEQSLQNVMIERKIWRNVVTIPTQVLVDPKDPSLRNPTKPIGPFYSKEEAEKNARERGWVVKEDAGRGWRRYVASPYPIDIIEKDAVRLLLEKDYIVIAGGGGGIPVVRDAQGRIEGVDCVIDKDLASMKIALAVGARTLAIITGVPKVAVNFGKPDRRDLDSLTLAEARFYYEQGQFPAGSMGPKVMAAIEFVQANPKNRCIITDEGNLVQAMLEGRGGTSIVAC